MLNSTVLLHDTMRSLISELTPELVGLFDDYYTNGGMTTVLAVFDSASMDVINDRTSTARTGDILTALRKYDIRTKLQVLRFGKRYTPDSVSAQQAKDAISDFLNQNNRVKLYDRGRLPYWMESKLRHAASTFIPNKVPNFTFDPFSDMPSGVTAEGLKNHFEKYLYYDFFSNSPCSYKLPVSSVTVATASKLTPVPKNFKGPRLICMEPLLKQIAQRPLEKRLRYVLEAELPKCQKKYGTYPKGRVDLHDQERNRVLAEVGSRTLRLATIDLSHASDSLTYSVVHAIIPKAWVNDVCDALSKDVMLPNGSVKPLYICGTMGACETFPLMTTVLWCIVVAAGETCINFGVGDITWFDDCAVYGDDIIVPCEWYETMVDFLTICGFIVNTEKSYTGSIPYRESCGAEFYGGEPVASIYWPRRIMSGHIDDLPSMIDLANRLFSIGAEKTYGVVCHAIDKMVKGVPRVAPDSDEIGIHSYCVSRRFRAAEGALIAHVAVEYKYRPTQTIPILTTVPLDSPFFTTDECTIVSTFDTRLFSNPGVFDGYAVSNGGYLYDMYRYYRFLATGPEYESELDRTLHVSAHRADVGRSYLTGYRIRKEAFTVYDPVHVPLICQETELPIKEN